LSVPPLLPAPPAEQPGNHGNQVHHRPVAEADSGGASSKASSSDMTPRLARRPRNAA
jgi:hypothetical protein